MLKRVPFGTLQIIIGNQLKKTERDDLNQSPEKHYFANNLAGISKRKGKRVMGSKDRSYFAPG